MRFLLSVGLLVVGCSAEVRPTTAAELADALADAQPGDTIYLAAGRYGATFVVPPGVTLVGAGIDETVVYRSSARTRNDNAALSFITAENAESRARDMTVITDRGGAAISAYGPGALTLENLRIFIGLGIGVGAEGLSQLSLTDVDIVGSYVPDDWRRMPPFVPTVDNSPFSGLVTVHARSTLTNVTVTRTEQFGALFVDSDTTWIGGGASTIAGTGWMVHGGRADLSGLELTDARSARLIPPGGGVISNGAHVSCAEVTVEGGEGYGLLVDDATASCSNLSATGTALSAIWAQNGSSLTLSDSRITNAGLAGVLAAGGSTITLERTAVTGTRLLTTIVGTRPVEVGDGVQVVQDSSVQLTDTMLLDNERAGLLWDLRDASTASASLSNVEVAGPSLGAVAQNGVPPPDWDSGVTRDAMTAANDADFVATGDALNVLSQAVATEGAAADLAARGLEAVGIVMPID